MSIRFRHSDHGGNFFTKYIIYMNPFNFNNLNL